MSEQTRAPEGSVGGRAKSSEAPQGAMTSKRYIQSLKDGREVWIDGRRVGARPAVEPCQDFAVASTSRTSISLSRWRNASSPGGRLRDLPSLDSVAAG